MDASRVAETRRLLHASRDQLKADFFRHRNAARLLKNHSQLIDRLLVDLCAALSLPKRITLVAVGGYGRGELFPASDIDLLVLLDSAPDDVTAAQLEQFVTLLWDVGLHVGHSVRTVSECLEEADLDITVKTNLLEGRFLRGARAQSEALKSGLRGALDSRAFFEGKLLEQQQRHTRFHDTAYNLEPNVKESPGGLRDLHNVLWISDACGLGKRWADLVAADLIDAREARLTRRLEHFLQTVRIHLHYLAQRREDRLVFDHQKALAEILGLSASGARAASERLMQRYYRTAKSVLLLNDVVIANVRERFFSHPSNQTEALNTRFRQAQGQLSAIDPAVFVREPDAIFEVFRLLQQRPELTGLNAPTLRGLWRGVARMDGAFRQNPRHRADFLGILRSGQGVTHALRRMNRYGVLGKYLPAWGRIVGQMQHDLFHVYTVDEHILFVVRNLRRFQIPEFAHEYPLCSRIAVSFERPEILYIAALFHDIAKGRGGDHSTLGKTDAARFCRDHGIDEADTALVVWLVENHLMMSATAQKQDLSDPAVALAFRDKVKTQRRLDALYLLTVADIRGTSPDVWNAWKARLLEQLYLAAKRLLSGHDMPETNALQQRQETALVMLARHAVPLDPARAFWRSLDENYFLRHTPEEIAWHARHLWRLADAKTPVVRARVAPEGQGIELMIYTADAADVFVRICSFFERVNYNVVEAKVYTTADGYALDTFLVLDETQSARHYRDVLSYLEYELRSSLLDAQPRAAGGAGRVSRRVKHFPIEPRIDLQRDERGAYYVLSLIAGDRPGLLSRIAHVFRRHAIGLHTAKITTLGERAEDTFLITSTHNTLENQKTALAFEADLLAQLRIDS